MNPSDLDFIVRRLERMTQRMEQLRLDAYLRYMHNWRKRLWFEFLGGIARGVGFSVGFSVLGALLLYLLRSEMSPKVGKLQTSNAVHSENEIIRQAQQYISAHIREKLSVPLVARQVDVSPSYLTALFHKNLQISPGEYIRRTKLQESKQMIRENNLNFTEIAAALQYSTVHHFSRQFKEKFGITPTEYAKSVR